MAARYELVIERTFNATHALRMADGRTEPMHGHDWHVAVCVGADALDAIDVVIDFHELEAMVAGVIRPWQHACLNDAPAFAGGNPSAERVAERIATLVEPQLPQRVRLLSVAVTEAPGCIARYRPGP